MFWWSQQAYLYSLFVETLLVNSKISQEERAFM